MVNNKTDLEKLFKKYSVKFPEYEFSLLNTTWHDLTIGRSKLAGGKRLIVDLFTALPKFVEVDKINNTPIYRVLYYAKHSELVNDIMDVLEENNIVALGSVITAEAFGINRVVKFDKDYNIFIAGPLI